MGVFCGIIQHWAFWVVVIIGLIISWTVFGTDTSRVPAMYVGLALVVVAVIGGFGQVIANCSLGSEGRTQIV